MIKLCVVCILGSLFSSRFLFQFFEMKLLSATLLSFPFTSIAFHQTSHLTLRFSKFMKSRQRKKCENGFLNNEEEISHIIKLDNSIFCKFEAYDIRN